MTLQHTAWPYNTRHDSIINNTQHHLIPHSITLQHTASSSYNTQPHLTAQHTASLYNTKHHITTQSIITLQHSITLQHTASPYSKTQWVIWCFKPSQPQRIISGLRETFIKRHIAERINKAEIRLEEQSEKAESCWENLWNEVQLKGP